MINGYSDHIPRDFRDSSVHLATFPSADAFAELERLGARYIVMHVDSYDYGSRYTVVEGLKHYSPYLKPLSQADETWLFEIVGWPR